MRRPYTPSYYSDLMQRIHSRIEDAAIGADVMVGFPGESDEEFYETYRLIEASPLTYLHVFPYSSRPGTHAATMPAPVPAHVARYRAKALRQLIARKNAEFRSRMIGRDIEVLVLNSGDAISSNFIHVYPSEDLPRNSWVQIRVTALQDKGLIGGQTPNSLSYSRNSNGANSNSESVPQLIEHDDGAGDKLVMSQ
jgi:threonylcarbamoyladenosine tRNA methylthiotransferase MtaB